MSDRCNGRKSSNDAGSQPIVLATMGAQQAVAKRSVGRRVTLLTRLFFSFNAALNLRHSRLRIAQHFKLALQRRSRFARVAT